MASCWLFYAGGVGTVNLWSLATELGEIGVVWERGRLARRKRLLARAYSEPFKPGANRLTNHSSPSAAAY